MMRWRRVAVCAAVIGAMAMAACEWGGAQQEKLAAKVSNNAPTCTIFDKDPNHLWNRLHAAMWLRKSKEGEVFGYDRLDPLLWSNGDYLLTGPESDALLQLLDEFAARDGHLMVRDATKRAVMQHDLWTVFDYVADHNRRIEASMARRIEQLQTRLARTMRKIALSDDEIAKLPDNFAAAVASRKFAATYDDVKNPKPTYLPADLEAENSPWIFTETGVAHTQDFGHRSFFAIFLRWPGEASRKKMLEYLDVSRGTFADPKQAKMASYMESAPGKYVEPPVGMQAAILRRMLVINDQGLIKPTPIVESLQVRVFRGPAMPKPMEKAESQSVYEFEMERALLFAGVNGGLHARVAGERDFSVQFRNHGMDEFKHAEKVARRVEPREKPVLASCFDCHSPTEENAFGLNSLKPSKETRVRSKDWMHLGVENEAITPKYVGIGTAGNKEVQFEWGVWRGLRMAAQEDENR